MAKSLTQQEEAKALRNNNLLEKSISAKLASNYPDRKGEDLVKITGRIRMSNRRSIKERILLNSVFSGVTK